MDAAGNVSTLQTAAFVVDTSPLAVRWIAKIPIATQDTTPSFTFNVSEASKIIYSGSCLSEVTEAVVGDNEITLNKLEDGGVLGLYNSIGVIQLVIRARLIPWPCTIPSGWIRLLQP